ncbi:hypothetical protein Taro_056355 [Colocasia esculenta]|uniref:Uncharacterized protein n=1 Tax=Colocasia esculenta TaxID=4460 RepID=A0A843XWD3_COLES|nr:hypothetical protein [Colocasia esculenta]
MCSILEDFKRVVAFNLMRVFPVTKHTACNMVSAGQGSIIIIANVCKVIGDGIVLIHQHKAHRDDYRVRATRFEGELHVPVTCDHDTGTREGSNGDPTHDWFRLTVAILVVGDPLLIALRPIRPNHTHKLLDTLLLKVWVKLTRSGSATCS